MALESPVIEFSACDKALALRGVGEARSRAVVT